MMASDEVGPSNKKTKPSYAQLCRLLVDCGCQALRVTFDNIHHPGDLYKVLSLDSVQTILKILFKQKILSPAQWEMLYPVIPSSVSSASFDPTLLMVLLRSICHLKSPANGWDNFPSSIDKNIEDDIARIRYYRTNLAAHSIQASLDYSTFDKYWQDIHGVLMRLGLASYGTAIDELKSSRMDPDIEEHYQELLRQWERDEDDVKKKLLLLDVEMDKLLEEIHYGGVDIIEKWIKAGRHLDVGGRDLAMEQREKHRKPTDDELEEFGGDIAVKWIEVGPCLDVGGRDLAVEPREKHRKPTDDELEELGGDIAENWIRLGRHLDVEGRDLAMEPKGGDDSASSFAEALLSNKTLTTFKCRGRRVGDGGMDSFAKVLEENKTLTHLDLSNNIIGDHGACLIAKALENNVTLKELNLSKNRIRNKGAIALANALKVNKTLVELDVSNNIFGDDGIEDLSEVLKTSTTIKNLSF